jgi:WD40 repeat protein
MREQIKRPIGNWRQVDWRIKMVTKPTLLISFIWMIFVKSLVFCQTPELVVNKGHSDRVSSVAFSPDGRFVVTGSQDSTAKLWDVATGKELRTFGGHSHDVLSVAFSPDGRYVVTGNGDKTARLWDPATGKELRTFAGHSDKVLSVAFSTQHNC